MAKSQPVVAGVVKETVTQERYIPEDEARKSEMAGVDLWDYMESTTEEDWVRQNLSLYVYRDDVKGEQYLVRSLRPVDRDFLRDKAEINIGGETVGCGIGGGDFHYYLKRGRERLLEGRFKFAGPVKRFDGAATGGVAAGSDMVRIVEMVMNRMKQDGGNGGSMQADVTKAAFLNALEIQKAAILSNQTSPAQMMEMVVKLRGEQKPSEMPDWLKQLLAAAIPALATGLVGVITKSLAPQDALASLKGLGEAMSVLKTMGGEPAGADIGVELLRNGPMLLGQVGNVLEKLNRAQEMRIATARIEPVAPPNGAPAAAAPPPGIPAGQPPIAHRNVPASAVAAQVQAEIRQAPAPGSAQFQQWLADRIMQMAAAGDDGKFVHDWLDVADPETIKFLRAQNLSLQEFEQLLASGLGGMAPRLADLAALPNFKQFAMEFHAALTAGAETSAAA